MIELDCELEVSNQEIDCEIDGKVEINAIPKEIRPLTVTENGTYDGGFEGETQIGYSPITVAVPEPVIKPFTFTENGTFNISKSFRYGETLTVKDFFDEEFLDSLDKYFYIQFEGQNGDCLIGISYMEALNSLVPFLVLNLDTILYMTKEQAEISGLPENIVNQCPCWINNDTLEVEKNIQFTLPTLEEFETVILENTTFEEIGNIFFDEDIYENVDGANPITVAVKPNIEPITITKNGTYTAEDCDGYSPIEVNVPSSLKKLLDYTQSMSSLLSNKPKESFVGYIDYNDTSECTNFENICSGSTGKVVKQMPLFDTRKANTVAGMLANCIVLEEIPAYDLRNANWVGDFMVNCQSVTAVWVKNIKKSIQVGSGSSWGHLLTLESLIYLIGELRDTGSLLTFTVGSVNLEKLANVYVRTIEITDEMREQDDLIDEKLPFEVCESTDEGAMLIGQYVQFKNWQLG